MPDSLLTLKNAGFRYDTRSRGHWIFHDVNLNVAPGEVLAILGRNGVGKSTLLNTIIGLLPLTEGEVVLGDKKAHGTHRLTAGAPHCLPAADGK